MIRKAVLALLLGAALALGAPPSARAQGAQSNTTGSNGGFVAPAHSGVTGEGAKNVAVGSDLGSPASEPSTSLSDRAGAGAHPVTREGDVTKQIAILAPIAFFMFLVLAGALYWFVFRRATSEEGDAAAQGKS